MVMFARFARMWGGKKSSRIASSKSASSSESLLVSNNKDYSFSCNVKFLGSFLVDLAYEDQSILDAHAGKKKNTERVRLTLHPDYIYCTGKKSVSNILYVHSPGDVRGFFVHPQKRRVFGYLHPNIESGTVQLFCFRTPKKSRINGDRVQSAWLKVCQGRCSAQPSLSTLEVADPPAPVERTEPTPVPRSPPPPPSHSEDTARPAPVKRKLVFHIPPPPATPPPPGTPSARNRPSPAPQRMAKQTDVVVEIRKWSRPCQPLAAESGGKLLEEWDAWTEMMEEGLQELEATIQEMNRIAGEIETGSQLNGSQTVTPPTPKPRSRVLTEKKDAPTIPPHPAPRRKTNERKSQQNGALKLTPPTPKPRTCVTAEKGASPLDVPKHTSSTLEPPSPVPPTRGASLNRRPVTEEPVCDAIPAECNASTTPVIAEKTSESGKPVEQARALIPVELSGMATHQQSKNPPHDYASMLYGHCSVNCNAAQKQPQEASREEARDTKQLKKMSVGKMNLRPSISDSQIVRGTYAFKPCLSGHSSILHSASWMEPQPNLAGTSGIFTDPVQSAAN